MDRDILNNLGCEVDRIKLLAGIIKFLASDGDAEMFGENFIVLGGVIEEIATKIYDGLADIDRRESGVRG